MMVFIIFSLATLFGATHRRGWGGGCPKVVAVVTGIAASMALIWTALGCPQLSWLTENLWISISTLLATLLHAQAYNLPGHGESMDMGTMGGTEATDFRAMLWRYIGASSAITALLWGGVGPAAAAMLIGGPIPAIGYRWAARRFAVNHTVYGEIILGTAWYGALGLVAALSAWINSLI